MKNTKNGNNVTGIPLYPPHENKEAVDPLNLVVKFSKTVVVRGTGIALLSQSTLPHRQKQTMLPSSRLESLNLLVDKLVGISIKWVYLIYCGDSSNRSEEVSIVAQSRSRGL